MAGYADATAIASEFKQTTFGTTGAVTDAELLIWSDEFSRYVDGMISKRYTVPVTGTESVKVLSLIVKNFVAARVMRILNSQQATNETELNKATALEKMAMQMLKAISKGDITLPDAEDAARLDPASYNEENAVDPIWELETEQW